MIVGELKLEFYMFIWPGPFDSSSWYMADHKLSAFACFQPRKIGSLSLSIQLEQKIYGAQIWRRRTTKTITESVNNENLLYSLSLALSSWCWCCRLERCRRKKNIARVDASSSSLAILVRSWTMNYDGGKHTGGKRERAPWWKFEFIVEWCVTLHVAPFIAISHVIFLRISYACMLSHERERGNGWWWGRLNYRTNI